MTDEAATAVAEDAEEEFHFSLEQIMVKVRRAIAYAERPDTPAHEAQLARGRADAMMLKFSIREATIRDAQPMGTRRTPKTITVGVGTGSSGAQGQIWTLARMCAAHTRCKLGGSWEWDRDMGEWAGTVYGWEGDVEFFNILYTTVRLHMLGVLLPTVSEERTFAQNVYVLHNAGYDWREVARFFGWELTERGGYDLKHTKTGEVRKYSRVVGEYRRAYRAECERLGEDPHTIRRSETYRDSAAQGYTSQMSRRLRAVRTERDIDEAGAIVLRNSDADLEQFVREDNAGDFWRCPHCSKLSSSQYTCDVCKGKISERPTATEVRAGRRGRGRSYSYQAAPFNEHAYAAGVRHADTADISGHGRTGSGTKRELG